MNQKREIIIISAVLGLISLVLLLVFVWPLLKSIKNSPLELVNVKKELALFQDKATGNIKEIYQEVEPNLEKVDQLFIDSQSPIDLIKFWRDRARELNLNINISPLSSSEDEKDYWNNIVFRLNLTGSFSDFIRFLEKTESGPYLAEVRDLTVRKLSESELVFEGFSSGAVKADLTLKVFVK